MPNPEQKKAPKLGGEGSSFKGGVPTKGTGTASTNSAKNASANHDGKPDYSSRESKRDSMAESFGAMSQRPVAFQEEDPPINILTEAEALGKALARDTKERVSYLIENGLVHHRRHKDLLASIRKFISDQGSWDEITFTIFKHHPDTWIRDEILELKDLHGDHDGNGKPNTWEPTLEVLRDVTRRRGLYQLANQIHVYSRSPGSTDTLEVLQRTFQKIYDIEEAISKPDESLIQDGATFSRKEIEKAPVLIEGLLKQGSKMVLGGGSKSFKTWTLLNLGLSVAYGKPFWGHEVKQGRVLYVDMELDEEDLQFRKNWIERAMGIRESIPGKFDVLPLRRILNQWRRKKKQGINLDPFEEITKIIGRSRNDYSLILLDPLYKFLGDRKENDTADMADLFADIEYLSDETGAAVVVGVHFSKGNQALKEVMDRISGSGVFARDPDSIVVMTPLDEKQGDFTFQVEARLRKFKPLKKFAVRWEEPLMVRDDTLDADDLKGKGGRKQEYDPNQVLEQLPTNGTGLTRKAWQVRSEENEGLSKGTFDKLVIELKTEKKVFKSKTDNLWYRDGQ